MNSSKGHSCDQNIISKLVQKNSVSDFHNLMKQTQAHALHLWFIYLLSWICYGSLFHGFWNIENTLLMTNNTTLGWIANNYYLNWKFLTVFVHINSSITVQHILAQLGTPSHCFYPQLWGTQCRSGLKKGWATIIRAIFQLDHDQLASILLSRLFWIFQSTFKLQLMILAAITRGSQWGGGF